MAVPSDPLFAAQWHLRNAKAGQLDLEVGAAWSPAEGTGYTGAGPASSSSTPASTTGTPTSGRTTTPPTTGTS